jgi:alanine-glyoxylate transaminase / serine-glyoxylate transaminase / serine-pyruvate transaminase
VKSYNFDIQLLGEYWNCGNSKRIYHHTICSTLLFGLREAIALFLEQGGLEASWQKHSKISKRLYEGLQEKGFKMFINDVRNRVPSVTSIYVPEGVDAVKVITYAMQKYKYEIAGGLGQTFGKIFRVGLMGNNATETLVDRTVEILVEAIRTSKDQKVMSKM